MKILNPYRQICLDWCNILGESDPMKYVVSTSYSQLENRFRIEKHLFRASRALARTLGMDYGIANDFIVCACGSDYPYLTDRSKMFFDIIASKIMTEIKNKDMDIEKVLWQCAEYVHDDWVESNYSKYYSPAWKDKRYLFLPLAAIDYSEVKECLKFVTPLLNTMGIEYDPEKLKAIHTKKVDDFERSHFWKYRGKYNIDKIASDLRKGPKLYPSLKNGGYAETRRESKETAMQIVNTREDKIMH